MRVAFVGRKQVLDFLPLRVRQIAWVAFVLRTITFTLLFGPHEVTPCWRMENMGAPQSNRLLVAGSSVEGWYIHLLHIVLYHLGVWLWALSAWYWTRWAISLVEVYPPEPRAPEGV